MDNIEIIFLVVVIVLLFLSAFFSAAETAYSTINRAKFENDLKDGKKIAFLIKKQYKSFGWTLATIILSNSIVNVGLSTIAAYLFSNWLSSGPTTAIITTVVVTPILVIFGEITPKLLAKKYAYAYLKKIAYVLQVLNIIFWPFTYPLSKLTLDSSITNTEKDLESLLDIAKNEKVLQKHEATLAQKALNLDSTVVSSAMVKRKNIVSINKKALILDAKKGFQTSGHSRLAVKEEGKFIGILLLKDIIFKDDDENFIDQIKPLVLVTANKLISRALEKMRINRTHIAMVLKNKKSTKIVGLITVEDILEELVGEIYDEHDTKQVVREIAHFKYVIDGSAKMKDVSKALNIKFEESSGLTIKQWIQARIQRHIKKGLRYEYKDKVVFRIIENKRGQETLIELNIK